MKAPTPLSREILDRPRTTTARKVDYTELIQFIKDAEAQGGGGDIELEGETSKSAKKRMSNAMKAYDKNKKLIWLQDAPQGHIWFVIGENKEPTERTPRKRKQEQPEPELVGATA